MRNLFDFFSVFIPKSTTSASSFVFEDYDDDDDEFTLATTTTTTPSPPPFLVSTSPSPLDDDEAPFISDTNELLLPEQPRSLSNSFNKLNSFSNTFSKAQDVSPKDNQEEVTVIEEKRFPFTVVRVSSSVSQIRPTANDVIDVDQFDETTTTTLTTTITA